MQLHFNFSRTVKVHDLRIPYPLLWTPIHGRQIISAEVALRRAATGISWFLPVETLFSAHVQPGIEGCASGTLTLENFCEAEDGLPDWNSLREAYWARTLPFGQILAQQMFRSPSHPWSLSDASLALDVGRHDLKRRLFREAYSFASTLKRCRMLRILLSVLSEDMPAPNLPTGMFASGNSKLDSIFEASHQTRLSTIARSRLPARSQSAPPDRVPPSEIKTNILSPGVR